MEVLRFGYCIPFLRVPPLSKEPIPMASYFPTSTTGIALEEVTLSFVEKGAVELAPLPSPGFYSRMFVVWKTSGSWRPVIDLSVFNRFVLKTPFKMETIQSVLLSVRQGDWMVSIDPKEAYLQVPVHPDSCKYLRFVAFGKPYQFRALCFSLSTAPQVFTRVVTPISTILHSLGIRMCRYLDDWLIQASSRETVLQALSTVLSLCQELGVYSKHGEIELCPSSEGSLSRYSSRCRDFQGFSIWGAHQQAYVSRQRISVLQAAARVHLAVSFGDSVLSLPSSSGGVASACKPSNSLYIARGITWRIPFWSPGRTTASRIFVGGWTPNVFFRGCLCLNAHPISTSGPTRQTSAGGLTSIKKSFQASGFRKRLLFP